VGHRFRIFLSQCAAATALATGFAAHAEGVDGDRSAQDRASYRIAQMDAAQPRVASADSVLGEVVVTARRRAERLQDVPVAVTAIDSQSLQQNQISSAKNLEKIVPSLQVNSNSVREGGRYTLRGQGTTFGSGEGVVVYFAEAPVPQFASGGVGMYFDLDSVQVLNGPQGTLFGRNTTGGAVLFTPKKPDNGTEGFLEVGYGNYNNREATGAINIPVVADKLMIRFAATGRKRDGFTRNLADGKDYDDLNYWGMRLGIVARPTDNIENYLLLTDNKSEPNGSTWVITHINPTGPALRLFPRLADEFAAQQARGPRVINTDTTPVWISKTKALINTTTWTLAPEITAKNIFSYFDSFTAIGYDLDGTPINTISFDKNVPNRGNVSAGALSSAHYTTDELQLSGKSFDNKLNWVGGVYYQSYRTGKPMDTGPMSLGSRTVSIPVENGSSKAAYVQGSLNLGAFSDALSKLNFTAGYRYTWDERNTTVNAWNAQTGACTTRVAFTPNCAVPFSGKFSAPTYTLSLDYHVTPSTLLYATNRRGYKSGGFNTSADPASGFAKFGPEYVVDYEAGLKTDFRLGFPIRLNIAIFNDDYKDIQRNQNVIAPGSNPPRVVGFTLNAAKARIRGFEAQSTLRPVNALTITAFYSYLDARYKDYTFSGVDLSGYRLPFTPKHKVGLTWRYQLPVPEALGTMSFAGSYAYSSRFRWNDLELPGNTVGGSGLLDLSADWNGIAGSRVDASLFMTNVGDRTYRMISSVQYNSVGISSAMYGEPRMYGVRLRYTFD
jgi:iron complex outermembrane receptor protein